MKQENKELLNKVVFDEIDISDNKNTTQPEPIVTKKPEIKEDEKPKKSHRKLIIILSSFAVVTGIAVFIVWLFVFKGIYAFQGLPLSSFSNSYYSIKIPVGYSKFENNLGESGTDIAFSDPKEASLAVQSKVYIASGNMSVDSKEKYFNELDEQYSEDLIKKSRSSTGVNGAANIVYSKQARDGQQSRMISYDIKRQTDWVGRYSKLSIFSDGKIYEIVITSPRGNPGLAVDVRKIFDSFEIK